MDMFTGAQIAEQKFLTLSQFLLSKTLCTDANDTTVKSVARGGCHGEIAR